MPPTTINKRPRKTKDLIGIPTIESNDADMSIAAVISTLSLDRDNDIMIPEGCDLGPYGAGSAPVFFNHQQFPFPVGSTKQSPTSPLSVTIEEDHVWAKCFFNQASPEAETIYELVKLGHLGATSIGFIGLEWSDLSGSEAAEIGGNGYVRKYLRWELTEWSWVGVGANREAMSMHLSRGKIGGKSIPETLVKAFSPYVLPRKYFSAAGEFPTVTPKSPAQSKCNRCGTPDKPKEGKSMAIETGDMMPGMAMLKGMMEGMAGLHKSIGEAMKMVEVPEVRKLGLKVCKAMSEHLTEIGETGAKLYEGLEAPKLDDMDYSMLDEPGEEDEGEEEEEEIEPKKEEADEEEMKRLTLELTKAKKRLAKAMK